MKNDVRGMRRREFSRIAESKLYFGHIEIPGFSGFAGLMDIESVTQPWKVKSGAGEAVIADNGYRWLQLSPDSGGWWLTVMYDTSGNLVQYYFDITGENRLDDEGVPVFTDMYLDVVMNPGGDWVLLDRDELDAALESGEVDACEYEDAVRKADDLISRVDGHETFWRDVCARAIEEIKKGAV